MQIVCVVMLSLLVLISRVEARPRYVVRATKVSWKADPSSVVPIKKGYDIRLWDRAAGRVLWKRRVQDGYGATWSRDRRALMVEGRFRDKGYMWVWREGFRLRNFGFPMGADYSMSDPLWSSDNRRLLVRYGASGNSFIDEGTIFCLKLEPWPNYTCSVIASGVRKMAWKSRKTIMYWEVDEETDKLKKPRLWRAP
jgi:hypothetical protein